MSYTGFAIGGPLDGQEATSRFPRGFLLIDRPAGHAWLYDWQSAGYFRVRNAEPMTVDLAGRYRAAEEPEFDVLAAPWIGADGGD